MRICMLVLSDFSHDARVHKEAKTLAAAGHDVQVIALWQAGLAKDETHDGYRVTRLQLRTRNWRGRLVAPLIKYLEFAFQILKLVRHGFAQVCHAHDANTLPLAWLVAKRTGARLVYDAHELETGRNFGGNRLAGIYQHIWAWPERVFIGQTDAVLTVCDSIADELVRLYAISRPLVVINCPEWQIPGHSTRLRNELGIPPHLKVALYQGIVAAGRGIEAFLEAIQYLPDVVGVVLGDGPLLLELRSRVGSGMWHRVYLPGRVPLAVLPSYTASADIGVLFIQDICRSYHFALPNKLFEYIHAGIPVISNNLPEIARVIHEYQVGEVVDSEDPKVTANAIHQLLSDHERYMRAKANTLHAAAIFNWQGESLKLLDLYQRFAQDETGDTTVAPQRDQSM